MIRHEYNIAGDRRAVYDTKRNRHDISISNLKIHEYAAVNEMWTQNESTSTDRYIDP